jgi:hypothetical protein
LRPGLVLGFPHPVKVKRLVIASQQAFNSASRYQKLRYAVSRSVAELLTQFQWSIVGHENLLHGTAYIVFRVRTPDLQLGILFT